MLVFIQVNPGTYIGMYVCGGQRTTLAVGVHLLPFLEQISFLPLDCLLQATWPASVRAFSCLLPSCHRSTEVTDMHDPDFYVGSKNPNSCPLIFVAGILLTKPSAQLFVYFLGSLSTQPSLCPGWPSAISVPLPQLPSFWGSSIKWFYIWKMHYNHRWLINVVYAT